MSDLLKKAVYLLHRFFLIAIIAILIFAAKIPYISFHKRTFILPNAVLFLIGGIFLYLLKRLVNNEIVERVKPWMVCALMFVTSFIVFLGAGFITGWDPGNVFNDAMSAAQNGSIDQDYYSFYPNNRLIIVVLIILIKVGIGCGLTDMTTVYCAIVVVQCILFSLTGIMVYDYLCMSKDKRAALYGGVVYSVFIAASPFVFIVYTDALGVIFPVFMLWISKKIPEDNVNEKLLKWILIILVAVFGYYLKAPVFIMCIALVISFFIYNVLGSNDKRFINNLVTFIIVVLLGLFMMRAGGNLITLSFEHLTGVKCNDEQAISAYHYLMMGANDECDGTVNMADVELSASVHDYDGRIAQNKTEFVNRLKKLSIKGTAYLYLRKLALNFNDGSFGYAISGSDYIVTPLFEDSPFNSVIRKIYWPGRARFLVVINIAQTLWLGMIFWSLFNKEKSESGCAIKLAIIGAILFTTIFEAQARYLFIWSPLFLILAVEGLFCENKQIGE